MERPLTKHFHPDGTTRTLREYVQNGGYRCLQQLAGGLTPNNLQRLITEAGLRGRGGGGFPTGTKWSFVPMGPDAPKPKYIVANGDEMEPGTFKDRILMEGDPHGLVEGMILAALVVSLAAPGLAAWLAARIPAPLAPTAYASSSPGRRPRALMMRATGTAITATAGTGGTAIDAAASGTLIGINSVGVNGSAGVFTTRTSTSHLAAMGCTMSWTWACPSFRETPAPRKSWNKPAWPMRGP